ncbi:hypothetical protein [Falsiroseomonas selenitidurans]|nr:hypothetical protein [Falsiroseomonas selenitidurans]
MAGAWPDRGEDLEPDGPRVRGQVRTRDALLVDGILPALLGAV